jgi:hypothetical protein
MAIRDRGMDQERKLKPLLDEYEKEEFDRSIAYEMEYNLTVRINVWSNGFTETITGRVCTQCCL